MGATTTRAVPRDWLQLLHRQYSAHVGIILTSVGYDTLDGPSDSARAGSADARISHISVVAIGGYACRVLIIMIINDLLRGLMDLGSVCKV